MLVIENLPIYKEKGEVPLDPEFVTPIGRAAVAREGSDLTIVSHSFATVRALHVAEQLADEHGVDAEVVDLRSLRPLDVETVAASVAKTNRALCVEEGWPTYGVTAELAARIQKACFDDLDAPVERVGMAEVPLPYAKNLETGRAARRSAGAGGRPEHARAGALSRRLELRARDHAVQPARQPPVAVAEQLHHGRHEHHAHDRRVDQRSRSPGRCRSASGTPRSPSTKAPNTATMIAAAAVITRAVRARPSATAPAVSPPASHASRTRESRNTS